MTGVVWCCCIQGAPPPACPCNCVCTQAFEIMDQDTGEYLGVWSDEGLVAGNSWTLIYWTNECGEQTELGVGYHQYNEPDDSTTIRTLARPKDGAPETYEQRFAVEIRQSDGAFVVLTELTVEYPGSASDCKMRVFRFRQVMEDGFLVPEMSVSVYTKTGIYTTTGTLGAPPAADTGFYPQSPQKSYLGSLFPFDTPKYDPNFSYFAGCISNVQTFNAWLSDAQLLQLWDNGDGLSPSAVILWQENIDQWCAADPHPFQEAVGSKAGTVLKHDGVEWDQNGAGIQDGNGQLIQGLN